MEELIKEMRAQREADREQREFDRLQREEERKAAELMIGAEKTDFRLDEVSEIWRFKIRKCYQRHHARHFTTCTNVCF